MAILDIRALTAGAFTACASLGCLLAEPSWGQGELSFTREDISLGTFIGPRQSAAGDFNGDSQVDLVIGTATTATSPAQILILLGNGDGDFQPAPSVFIGQEPSSIVVADFNNDSRQDLAAASSLGNVVAIRLGNGDGTFQAAPDINIGDASVSAATGDFNGDGAQDLAISVFNNGENNLRIYLGNGDGTFSQGQEIVERTPRALTVGDFDGDGQQDLAAIDFTIEDNRVRNRVLILLGQDDGTFEIVPQESVVGPEASSLTVGDFDADGQQDVATADPNADVVSVLLGNGDGTFEPARDFPAGVQPGPGLLVQPVSIKAADFNGDGRQDLATGNRRPSDPPIESGVSILLGRGDGTFEPAQEFATAEGTASLVVADFNNDGQPDLATANHETSTVTILINDSAAGTAVQIDIRPGDSENRINPRSNGEIRVAILTSDSFDATEVDPTTVRFGRTGTEAAPVHFDLKDVDRDGNTDIVLRFRIQQTGIACGDTSAALTGRTFGGQLITGSDSIRTVGCGTR
jgi:hypothetical protein